MALVVELSVSTIVQHPVCLLVFYSPLKTCYTAYSVLQLILPLFPALLSTEFFVTV